MIAAVLFCSLASAAVEVRLERPNGSTLMFTGAEDSGRVVIEWQGDSYLIEFGAEGEEVWTRATEFYLTQGEPGFETLEVRTVENSGSISAEQWKASFDDRKGLVLSVQRTSE